jgi:fucose permease
VKFTPFRLAVTFFGFVLVGANSGTISVILPGMSSYYHIDNAVVGFFFLASATGYFLSALCSSLLLQKLGLRLFLLLGVILLLLGTLTIVVRPSFEILLATRLFIGVGVAFIETGSNAYVVALPRNTAWLNSLHAFYGAGALFGPIVAAYLLTLHWQWNAVFLLWMLLSVPMLIGVIFGFAPLAGDREASAEENIYSGALETGKNNAGEQARSRDNIMLATIKLPLVWLAVIFLLLYVGVETSVGNWSYTFLVEGQHLPTLLSGWVVSGYWLGLTLGRLVLARLTERRGISNLTLVISCTIGLLVGIILVWALPFTIVAALGFLFIGFSLGPIYPTTVAVLPTLVPKRLVTSAIGFLVSVSVLGIALFPWIAGILAQATTIYSLLPYVLAQGILMLLCWLVLSRQSTGPGIPSGDVIHEPV